MLHQGPSIPPRKGLVDNRVLAELYGPPVAIRDRREVIAVPPVPKIVAAFFPFETELCAVEENSVFSHTSVSAVVTAFRVRHVQDTRTPYRVPTALLSPPPFLEPHSPPKLSEKLIPSESECFKNPVTLLFKFRRLSEGIEPPASRPFFTPEAFQEALQHLDDVVTSVRQRCAAISGTCIVQAIPRSSIAFAEALWSCTGSGTRSFTGPADTPIASPRGPCWDIAAVSSLEKAPGADSMVVRVVGSLRTVPTRGDTGKHSRVIGEIREYEIQFEHGQLGQLKAHSNLLRRWREQEIA